MIDIEPLLIKNGDHSWSHPDIEKIAKFGYPEWAVPNEDYPLDAQIKVFRVYLKGKENTTYIVFKSKWFERHLKRTMFNGYNFTKKSWDEFLINLGVILFEDVWCPGGVQFLESEMYSILAKEHSGVEVTFMSADVVLCKDKDEPGIYYFES